ncbi:TPA: hypothetical protein PFG44_002717, partial [Staphylococcus aureus]|nr:hypothetical protein [Staphylococcus aureus]
MSVAVEQLLGSVDWVLDPANNQIKYKVPGETSQTCTYGGQSCNNYCAIQAANSGRTDGGAVQYTDSYYGTRWFCQTSEGFRYAVITGAQTGTSTSEEEEKSIPLETVAQKVISNAAGGDASAQQAITAAAQDVINEAENDTAKAAPIVQQLEASKAIEAENTATGEQTQNPEKPNVTDISLEFPAFCGWAPTVCEAAQTVISFPRTLTNWWDTTNQKADSWANSISQSWAEAKEWATSEKNEDTELDIPDQEQPDIDTDIAFGGMCPDDRQAEINMGVGVIKMPISYEPICTTVSTAKPVLIFVGFFVAALIIGGV